MKSIKTENTLTILKVLGGKGVGWGGQGRKVHLSFGHVWKALQGSFLALPGLYQVC